MARSGTNHELAALLEEARLSQAQLARQVVVAAATAHGLRLAYDYRAVGRWLGGAIPDPPTPALIADVLSRALRRTVTVSQLGLDTGDRMSHSLTITATAEQTVATATELWRAAVLHRRGFLTGAAFAAPAALEAAVDWRWHTARPDHGGGTRRVADADVAAIREATAGFSDLDHAHGAKLVLPVVHQYLVDDVTPLLRHGSYTDAVGVELFRAAAFLSNLAGWMAVDLGHHRLAQALYTQGVNLAKHGGNQALGAMILGNLSTQALYVGETRTAVRIAREARENPLPATLTARICATEARAHAALGDTYETDRMLATADAAMSRADADTDPEWLAMFTPAHYAAEAMHALADSGRPDAAIRYADAAVDLPDSRRRARALHTVLHASVLARRSDVDGACDTARTALHASTGLRSRKLVERLKQFDASLAAHTSASVADYRDESHEVLAGAA